MKQGFGVVTFLTATEVAGEKGKKAVGRIEIINASGELTGEVYEGGAIGVSPSVVQTSGNQPQNKYDATVAPAVTNDSSQGYAIGSRWIDVTNDESYICTDATVGAASWSKTTIGTIAEVAGLQTALENKEPKVAGKGLSTNDYTTTEKK